MRNGPTPNIPIGEPRALVAADLERLREPRFVATTPQKLRESHHMIARFAALGLDHAEVGTRTGYSRERVRTLLDSPAMKELVAKYRAKIDETYVKQVDAFFELATGNMLAAERHIADTIAELDEKDELLPVRTALAISRDAADRFGFGKHSTQTNVNIDFAAKLEAAIRRSGKQIEGKALNEGAESNAGGLTTSRQSHAARSIPSVASHPTQPRVVHHRSSLTPTTAAAPQPLRQPTPLVRRRA